MSNDNITTDETLEAALFEQLDDEPMDWYERFMDYYVALGRARTLRAAYLLHNQVLGAEAIQAPPYAKWRESAREFRWKKRSAAYDYERELHAQRQVQEARGRLMSMSVKAVEALEQSLTQPRQRVSGAKAILDRAGLPPVKEIKHKVEAFSADELNQASEELEAWEKQMAGSNGSNANDQ